MPDLLCRGGGGVNPTSMAQNDTHVALIILTTQMWGGKLLVEKTFSGQNFVFLRLRRQHPFLHKTKGPTRNPISPTPPPPPSAGVHVTLPPPPPAEQFSGRPTSPGWDWGGGGHEAMVLVCLPLAPIGLSPLRILTLCGSELVLVVSPEPLDDLSSLTTPGSTVPETGGGGD